jgi:hypothetical protein
MIKATPHDCDYKRLLAARFHAHLIGISSWAPTSVFPAEEALQDPMPCTAWARLISNGSLPVVVTKRTQRPYFRADVGEGKG